MADMNFEGIGRFIYGAARYGGDMDDVKNWIADDLEMPCPAPGDDSAALGMYRAFSAKYPDDDSLRESYERFMEVLKSRSMKR
jgi:hypothetical protein